MILGRGELEGMELLTQSRVLGMAYPEKKGRLRRGRSITRMDINKKRHIVCILLVFQQINGLTMCPELLYYIKLMLICHKYII